MGKVIVHPTGHVEIDVGTGMQAHPQMPGQHGPQGAMGNMHGHPAAMQPAPQPGVNSQEGMSPDPMAAGMKGAMDNAFAKKEPILKPDSTRGGKESADSQPKTPKSVGKKPAPIKGPPTKAKGDNGKPPKATSASKQK